MNDRPPYILVLVDSTLRTRRRSGIQRLVIEATRALAACTDLDLVRYDPLEGGLRFLDTEEVDRLWGPGAWPEGVRVPTSARRTGRPFRELLPKGRDTWLLAGELPQHSADGQEHLARVMSQCREAGVRTACVFYDLIPITNPAYAEHRAAHASYLVELTRADLIVPISRHSGRQLADYWTSQSLEMPPIRPVLLPEGRRARASLTLRSDPSGPEILLAGTIEPRKRQVDFLDAFAKARARSVAVRSHSVRLIGSVHPAVADDLRDRLSRQAWVRHSDYVPDAALDAAYAQAAFTAFVSDDEGYGLPISESLAYGTPCLCASFGAMAEVAAGGGCHTVDVRDPAALEQAIVDLCEQPARLQALRDEINARQLRGWADYAGEVLELLRAQPCRESGPVVVEMADGLPDTLSAEDFVRIAEADVVQFPTPEALQLFINEAAGRSWSALLPAHLCIGPEQAKAAEAALGRLRGEQAHAARTERAYAAARRRLPASNRAHRPRLLRIVISTYNRRAFVSANVAWLLGSVLPADGSIDLVVVDGASTDGTAEALQQFSDPRLRVVSLGADPGMLGGLRVAAGLTGAEYVWVVGDDDFLHPEQFGAISRALNAVTGVPLAVTNFAVYHREAWSAQDRPEQVLREARPVAGAVAPSGLMPITRIAEQTDNLFTAIYTLIWRADVLAAAFDHAFDGAPFESLTEAVPCTEAILARYARTEAYWHDRPAVIGNAHNSWSARRPLWHGVIMPQVFALARDSGVSRTHLEDWARRHAALLDEALHIARTNGVVVRRDARFRLAQSLYRSRSAGALR